MVAATASAEPERPELGEQRLIFDGVTYKDYVLLGDVPDLDFAVLAEHVAMPDQDDAVRAYWDRLRR